MEQIIGRTTEDRFNLKCRIVKKRLSYREHQSKQKEWNEEAEVIILVPEITDESTDFFRVWLPEKVSATEQTDEKDYMEIGFLAKYPINGFVRGAVMWGNFNLSTPHIFVMTRAVEEALQNHIGKAIDVVVLGEQEVEKFYDAKAETAPTIEGFV